MIKFIDCCSGIGGFHLGVTKALPDSLCVSAIEIDKNAISTHLANFPLVMIENDLTKIDPLCIPNHDLLCAGIPCVSHSIAGKRTGLKDPRGNLFFDVLRILEKKRPPYVIIENVPGILREIDIIKEKLGKLYDYVTVLKLNSVDFGLAQYRKRVFIVCSPQEFNFFYTKVDRSLPVRSIFEKNADEKYYIKKEYLPKLFDFKKIDFRKPLLVGYFREGQGYKIYSDEYPSITLTVSGGGYAGKTGAYMTNTGIRKLTPKECLRLQGFPDDFIIKGNPYKLLGNAVSVNVVQEVVKQLFGV